jgi:hypothetical protein
MWNAVPSRHEVPGKVLPFWFVCNPRHGKIILHTRWPPVLQYHDTLSQQDTPPFHLPVHELITAKTTLSCAPNQGCSNSQYRNAGNEPQYAYTVQVTCMWHIPVSQSTQGTLYTHGGKRNKMHNPRLRHTACTHMTINALYLWKGPHMNKSSRG